MADRLQQAAIVEPVDPFECCVFDCFQRAPWSPSVHHLDFIEPVDRLGEGVLAAALDQALDDPTVRARLLELGSVIPDKAGRTPDALQKLVESEVARWLPVLKDAAAAPAAAPK